MNIYLATDHAGFALKEALLPFLVSLGHKVEDCGAYVFDGEDDYPDIIAPCAEKVAQDPGSVGIIIGGSGQGEAMVANRVPHIRAAVFYGDVASSAAWKNSDREKRERFDTIRFSRLHNDANILSLGARFISVEEGKEAARVFLATPFSHDMRHVRRIRKFS